MGFLTITTILAGFKIIAHSSAVDKATGLCYESTCAAIISTSHIEDAASTHSVVTTPSFLDGATTSTCDDAPT